jgi:hypothetical protein
VAEAGGFGVLVTTDRQLKVSAELRLAGRRHRRVGHHQPAPHSDLGTSDRRRRQCRDTRIVCRGANTVNTEAVLRKNYIRPAFVIGAEAQQHPTRPPASPKASIRGAVRPARISLARAHPTSIDIEVQPSRCVQILREGRERRVPARCVDAHRCSERPTRGGSNADAPRTLESSSPGTRAGSCRSRARRSHSPWGSRTASAAPPGPRSDRIIQVAREDAVPVMDQIPVRTGVCDHFSKLLQRPGRTRVCGDVHVRQSACAVVDDDKYVQRPKRRRDGDEEVAGEDGRGLIPQERRPAQVATGSPRRPLGQVRSGAMGAAIGPGPRVYDRRLFAVSARTTGPRQGDRKPGRPQSTL